LQYAEKTCQNCYEPPHGFVGGRTLSEKATGCAG
jgi:hypothetical protein